MEHNIPVSIYLSKEEKEIVSEIAKAQKISISELIRRQAFDNLTAREYPAEFEKYAKLAKDYNLGVFQFIELAVNNIQNPNIQVKTVKDDSEINLLKSEIDRLQAELYEIKSKEEIKPQTPSEFDSLVLTIANYVNNTGRGKYLKSERIMAHFHIADAALWQKVVSKLIESYGIEYGRDGLRTKGQMTF